jgi:CheY-like chemotaxis protein
LENYENMLILMDIKIPVMNGIDALNEIRKLDRKIPVIAVTAYALESERFEILNNSINDYLTKPIKQEMLIESIEKLIHNFKN